jgi:hypothetical protein
VQFHLDDLVVVDSFCRLGMCKFYILCTVHIIHLLVYIRKKRAVLFVASRHCTSARTGFTMPVCLSARNQRVTEMIFMNLILRSFTKIC